MKNGTVKWFNPDNVDIFEPLTVHDYGNGKFQLNFGLNNLVGQQKSKPMVVLLTFTMEICEKTFVNTDIT